MKKQEIKQRRQAALQAALGVEVPLGSPKTSEIGREDDDLEQRLRELETGAGADARDDDDEEDTRLDNYDIALK